MRLRNVPPRLATGAFIAHSGWSKWNGTRETAQGTHQMASGAYPFLGQVDPPTFLKGLSVAEMTVGAVLLTPVVPAGVAGLALTAFSGGLVGLYARTPALRKDGGIWPSQQGTAIAKDTWMLGVGLGLVIGALSDRRAARKD